MAAQWIKRAFVYAMVGLAGGVFYREFTKWHGFEGRTALSYIHLHLIGIGALVCLLVALFGLRTELLTTKGLRAFRRLFDIGLPFMTVMFAVRGILQVLGVELTAMQDAAISGIAGLSHIVLAVSLFFLFRALTRAVQGEDSAAVSG